MYCLTLVLELFENEAKTFAISFINVINSWEHYKVFLYKVFKIYRTAKLIEDRKPFNTVCIKGCSTIILKENNFLLNWLKLCKNKAT